MAPTYDRFNIIIVTCEAICYIDLYLMMHVAFYGSKNQLIYHPYLTAKNYLRVRSILLQAYKEGN